MIDPTLFRTVDMELVSDNESCTIIKCNSPTESLQRVGFFSGYEWKFRVTKTIPKMFTIWSDCGDGITVEQWFDDASFPNRWKQNFIEYWCYILTEGKYLKGDK